MKKYILISIWLINSVMGFAQQDNPYKDANIDRVKTKIIHEFNRFEFLESIAIAEDGTIFTSNLFDGKVYAIKNGKANLLFDFDGMAAGLSNLDKNHILLTGSSKDKKALVYKINTKNGDAEILALFPQGMVLNGISRLDKSNFLIADSFKGVLWKLNTDDASVSIWLEHDLLKKASSEGQNPGANGVKVKNGFVYISNTEKQTMLKLPINKNSSPGEIKVFHSNVVFNDFEVDQAGNIYGASNVFDNVVKVSLNGEKTVIAQYDQGVAGSTCLTWRSKKEEYLLVSTNGGILKPNKCDVTPAKIVELIID